MSYVYMSDLVGTAPQSALNPIGIYDGPRVGDEFKEWNAMSGAGRKSRHLRATIAAAASPGGVPGPAPGGDDDDAMGQTTYVDPPMDLDILYGMDDLGRRHHRKHGRRGEQSVGTLQFVKTGCHVVCDPTPEPSVVESLKDFFGMAGRKSRRRSRHQMTAPAAGSSQPQSDDSMGYGSAYGMGQVLNLGIAQRLAGEAIQAIEFRSQVTPPVVIDKPFAAGPAQPPQVQGGTPVSRAFMERIAKPAVYIKLVGGGVVPMEPYGKPVNDYTGLMLLGTAATAAVGVFVGIKIGQKLFCKK